MEQQVEHITILWKRYLSNTATLQEVDELFQYLERASTVEQQYLSAALAEHGLMNVEKREAPDGMLQQILQGSSAPDHRVHFLRRSWFRYAAAIILIAGVATIAVIVSSDRPPKSSDPTASTTDILPGTNKAVLTVDNKKIDLSADKTGITVGKDIAYTNGEKLSKAGKLLMLTTPNGGQYQLVLPDGTKAWLNAASSISFPSAFTEENRQVKITGEVYLEVAKDASKPFFVHINDQSTIEVLGTSFNVNAYADEGEISTTLIEGSVRVLPLHATAVATFSDDRQAKKSGVVLKPGQQALQPLHTTPVAMSADQPPNMPIKVQSADLSQTLAWKNGLFNFNGLSVREVLNQLARWYDIKVQIQGKEPEFRFMGKMYRSAHLSEVLKMLEKMEVRCRMEGKTLIVF